MFKDIIPNCYRPTILFIKDTINGESFLIGKNEDLIPRFFRSLHKRALLSRCFWTIVTVNKGFLECLRYFPPILLTFLVTLETEIFFFFASLVIFWHDSFFFLMASWLITWDLPERGRSVRDSETFKRYYPQWTVILVTFRCFGISVFLKPALCFGISVFLKPALTKWIFHFFLPFIRRYLKHSNFL